MPRRPGSSPLGWAPLGWTSLGWAAVVLAVAGCAAPPEAPPAPPPVQPSRPAPSVPEPRPLSVVPGPAPSTIAWQHGVEALEEARRGGRPALAFFRADWSASSRALARRLEDTEEVRRMAARLVAVTIDLSETSQDNEALAARYRIDHVPTVVVFDGEGRVARRLEGEVATDDLVDAMDQVTR